MTELEIESLGRHGEGVAAGPVYVPFALPGETVSAEVVDGRGRLLEVRQPSPARIAPHCPHFSRCGGCQVQHWRAAEYQAWKRGLVVAALQHRGLDAPVAELIDAHGLGRRRAVFHVRRGEPGPVAGFMEMKSHRLIAIDRCPVLEPALQRAAELARAIGLHAGDCDVAFTVCDSGLDVAVKAARSLKPSLVGKLAPLAENFRLARLSLNGETVLERLKPRLAIGTAMLELPMLPFLQATRAGEAALAALVLAGVGKAKHVADLFCGIGPFALRLAATARVFAADSDKPAVAALAAAVRATQGLKPVVTELRDLSREPLTARELNAFDAVVFDPPRAGAEAQARNLAQSAVPRLVAVSCDPGSFARDAALLVAGGYRLLAVTPVDQFRHTAHVEVVGQFER